MSFASLLFAGGYRLVVISLQSEPNHPSSDLFIKMTNTHNIHFIRFMMAWGVVMLTVLPADLKSTVAFNYLNIFENK